MNINDAYKIIYKHILEEYIERTPRGHGGTWSNLTISVETSGEVYIVTIKNFYERYEICRKDPTYREVILKSALHSYLANINGCDSDIINIKVISPVMDKTLVYKGNELE